MKYKKSFLIICLIICLFSIASVCASNVNETVVASENQSDELQNVENQDVFDVDATENEVLTASSDDEVIVNCDDSGDVLSLENCNASLAACDENGDILTMGDDNKLISIDMPSTSTVQSFTNYKTFTIAKVKLPTKYLKFTNFKPSKKNHLWKQYKEYKKYLKKIPKKVVKQMKKVFIKAYKNHWHPYGNVYYRWDIYGKNVVYTFYQKAYRRFNYNWITNEGWWD